MNDNNAQNKFRDIFDELISSLSEVEQWQRDIHNEAFESEEDRSQNVQKSYQNILLLRGWKKALSTVKIEIEQSGIFDVSESAVRKRLKMMLFGKQVTINSMTWGEILLHVCDVMILKKPYLAAKFDSIASLNREGALNFSEFESNLVMPRKKLSNGLWVRVIDDENEVRKLCRDILHECGYRHDDLIIETE